MAKLSQSEIDALVAKLQFYKYQVSYGGDIIGPLDSPPKIEPDFETKDTMLYETGEDPLASIISKNNATVTLETNDVSKALEMLQTYKKGDNILDTKFAKELRFEPITDDATAQAIVFPRAFLNPGLSTNFAEGAEPNFVSLGFTAKENDEGVLYSLEAIGA